MTIKRSLLWMVRSPLLYDILLHSDSIPAHPRRAAERRGPGLHRGVPAAGLRRVDPVRAGLARCLPLCVLERQCHTPVPLRGESRGLQRHGRGAFQPRGHSVFRRRRSVLKSQQAWRRPVYTFFLLTHSQHNSRHNSLLVKSFQVFQVFSHRRPNSITNQIMNQRYFWLCIFRTLRGTVQSVGQKCVVLRGWGVLGTSATGSWQWKNHWIRGMKKINKSVLGLEFLVGEGSEVLSPR